MTTHSTAITLRDCALAALARQFDSSGDPRPEHQLPLQARALVDARHRDWLAGARTCLEGAAGGPRHTATLLQDGRVLVAGGENLELSDEFPTPLGRAEVYDPKAGTWTDTDRMNKPRRNHAAIALNTGHVLVLGGFHESAGIQNGVELYDPGTGNWSAVGPMQVRREHHAALLLKDGRVLISGGITNPNELQGTYEMYYHPLANR